jgi:transcriptional regulator with XRE-family HTH domain
VGSTSHEQLYDAFGTYVRSQRRLARLTLRQAAELASISNPYLSQIEHGVALPSISVISSLAEALSVSVETMLLRAAGIVSPCTIQGRSHSEDAIRQDPRLDERQKLALLAVLASFVGSSQGLSEDASADESTGSDTNRPAPSRTSPPKVPQSKVPQSKVPQSKVPQSKVPQSKVPQSKVPQSKVPQSRISPSKIPDRPATAEAVSTRRKRT